MNKTDLKNGDTLVDFQMGYGKEFLVVLEDDNIFLESGKARQKIKDYDFKGISFINQK